jgi:hypothetical protein
VAAVLRQAAENRVSGIVDVGAQAATPPRRDSKHKPAPSWSLRLPFEGGSSKSVSRSEALESLAARLRELDLEHAKPYLLAAAERLESKHAAERAAAVELLSIVPLHTVDLALVPELGKRLDDTDIAFGGIEVEARQSGDSPARPAVITVHEVAQAGLLHVCSVQFTDAEAFRAWWGNAQDELKRSLWYWALCWRASNPQSLADLDDLEPSSALKVALLVGSDVARRAEVVKGTPKQFRDRIRERSYHPTLDLEPRMIADMVKRREMKDLLLAATAGELHWSLPEFARLETTRQTLRVLPHVLTVDDAPLLDHILQQQRDPWNDAPEARTEAVRVLANLVPDSQAEAVRIRELQRNLFLHGVAADLIRQAGWKHWTLIRQSYFAIGRLSSSRAEIIAALATRGEPAKTKLGELHSGDSLVGSSSLGGRDRQQIRFRAFVEAANRLSGDEPVVDRTLLESSCYQWGKGARDDSPHNLAVPQHRAEAVAKLRAFFQ